MIFFINREDLISSQERSSILSVIESWPFTLVDFKLVENSMCVVGGNKMALEVWEISSLTIMKERVPSFHLWGSLEVPYLWVDCRLSSLRWEASRIALSRYVRSIIWSRRSGLFCLPLTQLARVLVVFFLSRREPFASAVFLIKAGIF